MIYHVFLQIINFVINIIMKTDNFVTVITFVYPHELGIPQSLLESEGIECFVRDEFTVNVHPFYSNAIGGIRLQVRESDAQRAIEILTEGGFINKEEQKVALEEEKLFDGLNCPYCGSAEIVKVKKFSGKVSIFASVFLVLISSIPFLFPFFHRNYHCMDCGKDLKKTGKTLK